MTKRDTSGGVQVTLPDGNTATFDFSRITAKEMGVFLHAMRETDVEHLSSLLPKLVAECSYGPADDPATYDALPFYGAYMDLLEAAVSATKNARASSSATSGNT